MSEMNEIEPFPLTLVYKYKTDLCEAIEQEKAMNYVQICHTNETTFSLVFRLNKNSIMIYDYIQDNN